ncbi:hypothetical protein VPH35_044417 [Triticum aestivum]|uniref:Uncharacterized protein n=3 Tax=Triticum TaxID=4564 RepID=A0A9R0RI79_TRITD|nr:unnamed protein product [Triticum turgidum subsp. durum]
MTLPQLHVMAILQNKIVAYFAYHLLIPGPLAIVMEKMVFGAISWKIFLVIPLNFREMEELYMDGEKAARPEFTYPYCYEDHEVASLCAHVEEEDPLEWRYSLHNVLVHQSILDVQKSSVLG